MKEYQRGEPPKFQKKIKKRCLVHGKIVKASINKNCPKFVVGYCWYFFQKQIMELATPSEIKQLQESFALTEKWIKEGLRDRLNLANLTTLFGEGKSKAQSKRNYVNSKALFRFLSRRAFQILIDNKKIEKPLSYLICLQKLTLRLGNPQLVYKLQFK